MYSFLQEDSSIWTIFYNSHNSVPLQQKMCRGLLGVVPNSASTWSRTQTRDGSGYAPTKDIQ